MVSKQVNHELHNGILNKLFGRVTQISAYGWLSNEEIVDKAAEESKGIYLLILRSAVVILKNEVSRAAAALSTSNQKAGYLFNKNAILVERNWYFRQGMLQGIRSILDGSNHPSEGDRTPRSVSKPTPLTYKAMDLKGDQVVLECGQGSYIDPQVIVDSPEDIKIGSNTIIRKGVVLRPEGGEIFIGDNCVINHYCVLHGKGGIYIDNWSIIAPHCGIYAQNHSYDRFDIPITKQKNHGKGIYIMGDNWIGSHTVICDDVSIGKGAVVGANSTVTKSVPMATIVAGSPARIIKKRYSQKWDFSQRERASVQGMPAGIYEHVTKRGKLISELLHAKETVLDVACGEGILTEIIAKKVETVFACDYSYDTIVENQKRLPQIKFFYSNATSIRCPDNSFTAVVCSELAEHLLPNQFKRCLSEIHRVLAPGANLILTSPLTGRGRATNTYAHILSTLRNRYSICWEKGSVT